MKHSKRNVFMLCGLFLAVTAASCGPEAIMPDQQKETVGGTEIKREEAQTDSADTEYDIPEPDFGELSFGGEDFTFWEPKPLEDNTKDPSKLNIDYFYTENTNGEIINDNVFKRNKQVEEKLDVHIKLEKTEQRVDKYVLSGEDFIDAASYGVTGIGDLLSGGCFMDFRNLEHLNLEAEYWSPIAVKDTVCYNRIYMMPSDISMETLSTVGLLYFNKRIIQENDLENPYQMVYDNRWTLDNFLNMVRSVHGDLNGDGAMDTEDLYGFIPMQGFRMGCFLQFYYGSGLTFTVLDEDGGRIMSVDSEKSQNLIDRLREVLEDRTVCYGAVDIFHDTGSDTGSSDMFMGGHSLFYQSEIGELTTLREMEDDFGIVPNPKYDQAQESHFHRTVGGAMICIPSNIRSTEKTGAVLEYMAWTSHYTVLPAYYEITVKSKRVRDEDAPKMLDIVRTTVEYEFGDVYDSWIPNSMWDSYVDGSFSRKFDGNKKRLSKRLNKYNKMIENLEV